MGTIAIADAATHRGAEDEQALYASILEIGVFVGLGVLFVTFTLYVTGVLSPSVPLHELPNYWGLSVHEFLATTNAQFLHHEHVITGWSWLSVLGKGDYLNFVGIALLAGITIVCFLGIIPTLVKKHDWIYMTMATLEVLVLTLAASGILSIAE